MYELSPQSSTQEVVVMKGAQLGFTDTALNVMLYTVDYHPTSLLYIQKTIDAVERFSKQRFNPSVQLMPTIKDKIGEGRESSNTIRVKSFPGGIIIMGGANSAASLRSMPIEIVLIDEWDSFDSDIEEEGDPAELAIRRTANFPRRKIFKLSTPAIKETSKIEPAFEFGDQRRYNVPCPHCGQMQTIEWCNIKFKDANKKVDLNNIYLECVKCKGHIQEKYKTQMLENGKWIKNNPESDIASFHISALYSPIGFYSWKDAVKLWLKAERNFSKELLKVFINTVLGETFAESGKSVSTNLLESRKEYYNAVVPKGVLCLTAGVDIQLDRAEIEILGHGRNQETWSIDYEILRGDPEQPALWNLIDAYLLKTWKHENGMELSLSAVAIDSGNLARIVYNYCRPREFRRIFPIKGKDGWGQGYLKRPRIRLKDGAVWLFLAYVDEIKSKVYSQLQVETPGPGYQHFPDNYPDKYDDVYFKQLTAERLVTDKSRIGRHKLVWKLGEGRRNEALDCRVYAILALHIIQPYFDLMEQANMPMNIGAGNKRAKILSKGVQ
jgi:phage terminase large subunit GpA-like protein